MEIISKIIDLLNYASIWFEKYIASGLSNFFKGIGDLAIKILEFFIEIIRRLLS